VEGEKLHAAGQFDGECRRPTFREALMAQVLTVNVNRLVNEQKVGKFHISLIIWSFLLMLTDGYDIGSAAFAAPVLARVWHVVNRAQFAGVFTANLFGGLIGAPIFGYLGDHFGRKRMILVGAFWYGAWTLACAQATSIETLMIYRFLAGIGIGGVLPNTIALTTEFAPRAYAQTLVIIMFLGVTFGGGMPGPIAAWLVPHYGWQVLFLIGGFTPIAVAVLMIFVLPESLKYFAVRAHNQAEALRVARRFAPGRYFDPQSTFIVDETAQTGSVLPNALFAPPYTVVTPLLWILFIINLMTFYFLNSWIPIIFNTAGLPVADSALAVTLFQLGGTIGGIAICRPLDRYGFIPVIVLFAAAVPIVASIGMLEHNEPALMTAVFFAGLCSLGLQFGLNSSASVIYPTAIRSKGVGWAIGMGRWGAVIGPTFGGYLIGLHVPFSKLFPIVAGPVVIGLIVAIVLTPMVAKVRSSSGMVSENLIEAPA
jgi:MFS transporter, AAHS family, 4-hydroxybenzoate transporter